MAKEWVRWHMGVGMKNQSRKWKRNICRQRGIEEGHAGFC